MAMTAGSPLERQSIDRLDYPGSIAREQMQVGEHLLTGYRLQPRMAGIVTCGAGEVGNTGERRSETGPAPRNLFHPNG